MGLYAQLPHVKHMLRIKIPGGVLTADQLDAIADVTARWGRGSAHVTVRQDIQIHYLELEDSVDVATVLAKAGVTTVGACADSVRNVTASPYGGVIEDEAFDVTPHGHAITRHFLYHEMNLKLPRKFKIGISGSMRDEAQAMINDIGLFARVTDAGRGFTRLRGGRPRLHARNGASMARLRARARLAERVRGHRARVFPRRRAQEPQEEPHEVPPPIARREGISAASRRRAEGRARRARRRRCATRRPLWLREYSEPAPLPAEPGEPLGDGGFARWKRTNTIAQTQPGYHVVTIKLPLGDASAEQLRSIAELSRQLGNGTVRCTNQQNLVMRWVPTMKLYRLYRGLVELSLGEADALHITDVVTCPGTDYCSLAITQSMGVAARIREHLESGSTRQEADDVIAAVGRFEIKISGCPNACGQHQIGDVGMTGLMVTGKDGVERPHYSLRVGGGCGEGARVGARLSGSHPRGRDARGDRRDCALLPEGARQRRVVSRFRGPRGGRRRSAR